jgi:pimeloyl-ACP methyl ester carboxylesterase
MFEFSLDECPGCNSVHCYVVHARDDRVVALEDSELLAAHLGAELVIIPDSGHTVMNEAPDQLADLLVQWEP